MNPLLLILKGIAIGAANVIPGVSGGTMAFITGVYERIIRALSGFNNESVRLLKAGDIKGLAKQLDFGFLALIFGGAGVGIVGLGKILKPLFEHYPQLTWAFFFGLILASIYFVGKMVKKWSVGAAVALVIGIAIAGGVAMLPPAEQSDNFLYLMLCGAVAMCSMILPGVSGSYVLLLMGNYQLVMLDAVPNFRLKMLVPIGIGAVAGLLLFARVLRWIFRDFHDFAVSLLTGFVAGSLVVIWPWKNEIVTTFELGDKVKEKVTGYEWFLPDWSAGATWLGVGLIAAGAGLVFGIEWLGKNLTKRQG
ncbi:DUF368 domain-containing protein [Sulfuriroseicoccus oceanibius]|uniref:DUF368 domain-containing protein n=1 Tax=Sulfuriroseicoccus oceanibius TaxID=2707525 RepID=A0A6B3L934_9BACT|nr:DUF368 domain-containing protein [Sulfuriroseicoccus oceanibius]QQL44100.1 DUF368 domain-containing protein [Sulfuriroseicoccus oceanibius]